MKYFCSMNIFSGTLLDWYAENKRDLPWRNTTDPYLIWISEIILQQTRVAQGYEYFLRFIKRFPDVVSLAAASEDEVMKYWQGLGYYSRARNLHAAAKSMKGTFPKTYAEVRALKGVGDYTAAAICSFAYDMPYAAVDGNVYRVLSRYFGIDVPIDSTEGKKTFTALAGEVLDKSRPADYNQAIMDFGAVQCTPQSPNCLFCPLSGSCRALSEGKVQQLPVPQACDSATLYLTALPSLSLSVCYEKPTDLTTSVPVNHGITVLKRAGIHTGITTANDWPMVRNSAYTALESKTKGFVITRNASPETTIANPVVGMMVFDTDAPGVNGATGCLKIYTGSGASEGWKCFNTQGCP